MPQLTLLRDLATALDRTLPVPLGVQLRGLIEYGIACGELLPGARLPSVRELAEAGEIAPMTAASVYKDLQVSGLIVARPGSGTYVASKAGVGLSPVVGRVRAHLDAALQEAEAAGMSGGEVAALLSARIGRSRAREGRNLNLVMMGMFRDATQAYSDDIARHLKPGDSIRALTFDEARADRSRLLPADLCVTLANRKGEAQALADGRFPVTSVSFMPSETTRARLAAVDPLARVGLVSVFPEFLALMKPGVLRFAPHVRSVDAIMADDPRLADFLDRLDVVIFATGAQAALGAVAHSAQTIEYRHVPDPHEVQASLLPLVEAVRSGAMTPAR